MAVSRLPVFCVCGDHAFAAATKGHVILVSPGDAAHLLKLWTAQPRHNRSAVITRYKAGKTVLLSREIMLPPADKFIDHKSGDATDNRRENMREATSQENCFNRRPEHGKTIAAKGVSRKKNGRYQAQITRGGKRQFLGYFATEHEAAEAYARAATELHGSFARLA